jgi:cytochrome c553
VDKKILYTIPFACILFLGCSDKSKEEVKQSTNQTIDKAAQISNDTAKVATKLVEEVKKESAPVIDEVVAASKDVVDTVSKKASDLSANVQQKIHEATAPKVDGRKLFVSCASCHGTNGEKKALNTSAVIKGWDKEKALNALKGYKSGSYGGNMKSVMMGQLKNFNDVQLEALASHIATF